MRVTCPGVASRLPASTGTQNEWITSAEVIDTCTGLPTGTCISFAVTIPRFGYLYSHHHWCPITSILSASGGASPAVAKMVRTVGTATSARITAGARVQPISRAVCPCAGFGAGLRKDGRHHYEPELEQEERERRAHDQTGLARRGMHDAHGRHPIRQAQEVVQRGEPHCASECGKRVERFAHDGVNQRDPDPNACAHNGAKDDALAERAVRSRRHTQPPKVHRAGSR